MMRCELCTWWEFAAHVKKGSGAAAGLRGAVVVSLGW